MRPHGVATTLMFLAFGVFGPLHARGAPVPSGVYFARLSGTRTMRRITLLR